MGFFFAVPKAKPPAKRSGSKRGPLPLQALNDAGCSACPMRDADLKTPVMDPKGAKHPIVYILGESPTENDDASGEIFSGKGGRMLDAVIPKGMARFVRYNNTIRCHKGSQPEDHEMECCRKSIQQDIEESKPAVIIALGASPLQWVAKIPGGVPRWRGRLIPVRVGLHTCWMYSTFHPTYVLRKQGKYGKSEIEIAFERDLENVFRMLDREELPPLDYHDSAFSDGITCIDGSQPGDFERLRAALELLKSEPYVGVDIESPCLRPYASEAAILTVAIGTFDNTVAFPVDHPEGWNSSMRIKVRALLLDFLLNSGRKIAHNLKFEQEWFAYFFGHLIMRMTEWEDTMAQAHTLDERRGSHSLGMCTLAHFGFNVKEKSPVDAAKILSYPLKQVLIYNGMDSKWTHRLFLKQKPLIEAVPEYVAEYERLIRLSPTLAKSQLEGVIVNEPFALELQKEYTDTIAKAERMISKCPEIDMFTRRFGSFNAGSPDHVVKLLRDVLKRPEGNREDGGYSSDEEVLSSIPKSEAPSIKHILDHRGISKLKSTYIDPIVEKKIVHPDGRMHTSYNAMVAVTGRLSSDDPNLQNFPKRKHKRVRGVVIPPPDHWILSVDYGQIEARVIGMASEDKNLVKYLWEDYDIHGYWAGRFAKEYPDILDWISSEFEVDRGDDKKLMKTLRQEAKNKWVFPQFFGSSYYSCANNLHVPDTVAKRLADEFWDEFKGVKRWQDRTIAKWEKNLYVETLTGRRRRGPMSKNEIINTPIQGTAADIVTDAMNRLSEFSELTEQDRFQPVLNIHDDLTFYTPDETIDADVSVIAEYMCDSRFDFINVPIIVEVSAGLSWDNQTEIGVFRSDVLFKDRAALRG